MDSLPVNVAVSHLTLIAGVPFRVALDSVSPSTIYLTSSNLLTAVTTSRITISVFDVNGNLIPDPPDGIQNVSLSIIQGPGGGETISNVPAGEEYFTTTSGGKATADINSGIYPGTVTIRVTVLTKSDGSALSPLLVKDIPGPVMRGGAPYSLQLSAENSVTSNTSQGDLMQRYNAYVRDQWSASVADGTPVEFGVIVNERIKVPQGLRPPTGGLVTTPALGDLSDVGGVGGYNTFTSLDIVGADDLQVNDLIVITEPVSPYRGAHVIKAVDSVAGTVTFDPPLAIVAGADTDSLAFYAGYDVGAGFKSNLGTVNGKAVGEMSYPGKSLATDCNGAFVNAPVVIYSATNGGTVGDAAFTQLQGLAPLQFAEFLLDGGTVTGGATFTLPVTLTDSSKPTEYPVPFAEIEVYVTGGTIISPNTDPDLDPTYEKIMTDCYGRIRFKWTAPAAPGKTKFSFSAPGVIYTTSAVTAE
jgi:hypothetical protein